MAAERQRLAEGQPRLRREALVVQGSPEQKDVDPRVAPAGGGVPRHRERRLARGRGPRSHPGHRARLELGDDAIGDRRVDVLLRSEEHTSELPSLMRISYAVFCLKNKQYV